MKTTKLINKSGIPNHVRNSELSSKLAILSKKAEQDKIVQRQLFDSSYFHGNFLFGDDDFQNIVFIKQHLIAKVKKRQEN